MKLFSPNVTNATVNTDVSSVRIVPMTLTAHMIVRSVWIIFTTHLMPLMEHLKENMIVHTWQMFIHANTLVDIHLKSSMLLSDSRPYSI